MRSIWAVATNTIKQAVRMKIAAVFIVLLIVLLPVMSVSMTGDGTLKGRLQTFVSYSLSLTSLLLKNPKSMRRCSSSPRYLLAKVTVLKFSS